MVWPERAVSSKRSRVGKAKRGNDLRGGDGAWESSWDAEGGTVNVDGEGLGKLPGVMRKMKGWLRRRKARV